VHLVGFYYKNISHTGI